MLSIWPYADASGTFSCLVKAGHLLCVAGSWVGDHLGSVKDVVEILGIVVGGFWAYLNYIRGRVYKHRLEPSVSGRFVKTETFCYLVIRVMVKNVGLSKVALVRERINLIVYPACEATEVDKPSEVHWPAVEDCQIVRVLAHHQWIEPAEPIEDELVVQLPNRPADVYQLFLRIERKEAWSANAIVFTRALPTTNIEGGQAE